MSNVSFPGRNNERTRTQDRGAVGGPLGEKNSKFLGMNADPFGLFNSTAPIEQNMAKFSSRAFLEEGRESGKWFRIPEEVWQRAEAEGPEAVQKLEQLQEMCDKFNDLLSRTDIEDELKLELLQAFVGGSCGDFEDPQDMDDAQQKSFFGIAMGVLWSGDSEQIDDFLDSNESFCDEALENGEMSAAMSKVNDELTKWMKEHELDLTPDKTWEHFAEATLLADQIHENRLGMSPEELMADIERVRAERREINRQAALDNARASRPA